MVHLSSSVLTSLFIAGTLANKQTSPERACDEITVALPDRVSRPISLDYTTEVSSYWSTAPRDLKPTCLVLPQSAEEVSKVVKILNNYPDVPFAVKSGGHDPNVRHASVQDGILISTKDLAGVTYDAEKNLAYVKPGGEWNDVIGPLDEQGVAILGGRLGLVGVGGYLLQGGISFLSARHGLAADSIVGWEIVTADGSIINVDANESPELAVALRGSGSQFGIVTQFSVTAYPMGQVWGGMRIYGEDKTDEIFSALHDFVPGNNDDTKAAIILTDNFSAGGSKIFLIYYYYEGPEPPTTGAFAKFLEIESTIDQTSTRSYADMLKTNGASAELILARIGFRTFTIPYLEDVPEMYGEISTKFYSLVEEYLNSPLRLTSQCSMDFQPFPSAIGKQSYAKGGNAMGIRGCDPDRLLLEIQCSWVNPNDDEIFHQAARDLVTWLEAKVPEWTGGKEYYLPWLMNDAAWDQNVTGMYRDYAKFKALQEEMDPENFWSGRGGGFTY